MKFRLGWEAKIAKIGFDVGFKAQGAVLPPERGRRVCCHLSLAWMCWPGCHIQAKAVPEQRNCLRQGDSHQHWWSNPTWSSLEGWTAEKKIEFELGCNLEITWRRQRRNKSSRIWPGNGSSKEKLPHWVKTWLFCPPTLVNFGTWPGGEMWDSISTPGDALAHER